MTASRKSLLAAEIYRRTGVSVKVSLAVLNAISDIALDGVLDDGTFTLPSVATISVTERGQMTYKDVRTGEYKHADQGYKVRATPASIIRKAVKAASRGDDIRKHDQQSSTPTPTSAPSAPEQAPQQPPHL